VADDALTHSYDAVAEAYADRYAGELAHKPLDRALLDYLATDVQADTTVADAGCGPGHIAAYLHERGCHTVGIDLSPAMIALARRRNPGLRFEVGSMLALPLEDASLGGMVALYSIIHLTADELPVAIREFHRVLMPGAPLLVSFHMGDEVRHVDELLAVPVSVDFHFRRPAAVAAALEAGGLVVEATLERQPYTAIEAPTKRAYLFARRPV
jgi:SAM-dependent methyltransferase